MIPRSYNNDGSEAKHDARGERKYREDIVGDKAHVEGHVRRHANLNVSISF